MKIATRFMKELPKFFDYKTREPEIAKNWHETGVFVFQPKKEPSFKIDTPPPTVSGLLHMGHVFSYVQTDFIARYKRLMGFNVFYPIGFDDNGLPTERLVEKQTGKKVGKNATKEEFVEECFKVIEEAEKEFEALFRQIGLSVDFGLKYQTIAPTTAQISQASFIELYNKGLIYQKFAPVYWDTTDKTALAQADIEEKEVESYEVRYKAFIGKEEVHIMTTRPEMLPACLCVLFHPEDERYAKFEGKEITLPFEGLKVKMHADKDVSREKGTGLVMCCAFGDMQDKVWIERHDLWHKIPYIEIDENGIPTLSINATPREYAKRKGLFIGGTVNESTRNLISDEGLLQNEFFKKEDGKLAKVEEGREMIIKHLLAKGFIVGSKPEMSFEEALAEPSVKLNKIKHFVKCGERSGKPVEILLKNQWFASLMPFKRDLFEVIKKIDFHPAHMKLRLQQWIEGLNQDWCISRDRFFGISVPFRTFEIEDNVSRETLLEIQKDFYKEVFTPLAKKFGGVINENHFEMEAEVLHELMESPEFINIEDEFTISGFDLEVKNIGIQKYTIILHRSFEGLFNELLKGQAELINEKSFLITDEKLPQLNKLIEEKKEILKEMGVENLTIKTESLVLDTWFTSSLTPEIAWKSFTETPVFDLRPQAHEIIRTWAFYTISKAYLHSLELKSVTKKPDSKQEFNSREFFRMKENPKIIPWKNVMLSGWCLASDKTKMSKSKGNVITPSALIAEKGVDAIRLWCASSALGVDTAYSEPLLELGKKFINKLWNVAKFVQMKAHELKQNAEITEAFDKWIIAELGQVLLEYKAFMEKFEYSKALDVLNDFFWKSFCDNYLEVIKVRYYGLEALIYKENRPKNPSEVVAKQQSCLKTVQKIYNALLLLYAPFTPFITEELQSNIHEVGGLQKLQLPSFPKLPASEEALKVIEAIRKHKTEKSLAMNAKLEHFTFKTTHNLEIFLEDLKNVTGVLEFQFN